MTRTPSPAARAQDSLAASTAPVGDRQSPSGAGWTPGPWNASEMHMDKASWASLAGDHDLTIVRANWDTFTGDVIACVWADDDHDEMANARLIASAPELYDALAQARQALAAYQPDSAPTFYMEAIWSAAAALAKARGQ